MTAFHDAHDLEVAADADDLADRRDEARQLLADELWDDIDYAEATWKVCSVCKQYALELDGWGTCGRCYLLEDDAYRRVIDS